MTGSCLLLAVGVACVFRDLGVVQACDGKKWLAWLGSSHQRRLSVEDRPSEMLVDVSPIELHRYIHTYIYMYMYIPLKT